RAAVTQLGREVPVEHVNRVAALGPVVGEIAGGVAHDAHAQVAELDGLPRRLAGLAVVQGRRNCCPVDRLKRHVLDPHGHLSSNVVTLRAGSVYATALPVTARSGPAETMAASAEVSWNTRAAV